MMSSDLYQAFQRCLALVESGVPLEECLAQHPDYEEELRPLLLAAASPDRLSDIMPRAARERVRQRVMRHWDRNRSPRRGWSLGRAWPVRWAAAAAAVLLLTLGGGVGTVAAAQDATPGASLYPVKQLREETRLWFTRSPEEKVAIYSGYARERVSEVLKLSQRGQGASAAISLSRLEGHLNAVDQLLETVPPGTPLAQFGRVAIIETLENTLAAREAAGDVPEALVQDSEDTYPCLQHTIQVIRQAREQVRSALENVGGYLPNSPDRPADQVEAFCPPS